MKPSFELDAGWDEGFAAQIMAVCARQASLYSIGSSSVPEQTAQDLFSSVCFTIALARKKGLRGSAKELFDAGQLEIGRLLQRGKTLLHGVNTTRSHTDNIAYHDTLAALPHFFRLYQPRFFATDIPCSIDYQLFRPAEGLGIEYILRYLQTLLVENQFVALFTPAESALALDAYCAEPREQLVNLFEAVATPVLGWVILGQPARPAPFTDGDLAALRLALQQGQTAALLDRAAASVASDLGGIQKPVAEYLRLFAASLTPRVRQYGAEVFAPAAF